MHKITMVGLAALSAALAGCRWFESKPKDSNPPTPAGVYAVQSMDDLQKSLADRAGKAFNPGAEPDFQVIVTQAAYPIGTLIRQGSTVPEDYSACAPVTAPVNGGAPDVGMPPAVPVPNLFPTYSMSTDMAAQVGLDDAVFRGLMSAGAKIDRKTAVSLAFDQPQVIVLSQADIRRLAKRQACADAVGVEPVWLVRGYVSGKRKFTLGAGLATGVNASIPKIVNFDVTPYANNGAIAIEDDSSTGFLEVISEIAPAQPAPLPPPPPPTGEANTQSAPTMGQHHAIAQMAGLKPAAFSISKPQTTSAQGMIYVQRDKADTPANGAKVVVALRAAFPVAAQVEAIDSARMPKLPEVRYFRDADADAAGRLLAQFKTFYPNAVLKRVTLPAPAGQMEVWLPRVG